jgi:hypothetical protein
LPNSGRRRGSPRSTTPSPLAVPPASTPIRTRSRAAFVVSPAASTSRSRAVARRRSGTSRSGGFTVIAASGEDRPTPRAAAATTVAAPGAVALGGDTGAPAVGGAAAAAAAATAIAAQLQARSPNKALLAPAPRATPTGAPRRVPRGESFLIKLTRFAC